MTSSRIERPDRPKISVILPTYCPHPEVGPKLRKCVGSIFKGSIDGLRNIELIAIEQGRPVMDSVLIPCTLWNYEYEHIGDPAGFAHAVNRGVSLSHGEYLLIINNDIVLNFPWDDQFISFFRGLSGLSRPVAMLSPIDQTITVPPGSMPVTYWDSWWSCVLIPRSAWDAIGPLDEEHLPYRFHDQDWSIRAHKAGYHVFRTQAITVYHDEASTYRHMKDEARDARERDFMIEKHGVSTYIEYIRLHGTFAP